MANTYYDSQLTAAEIEAALEAINGILIPANNGKVLAISNGKFEARSVQWGGGSGIIQPLNVQQNGTYSPPIGVDGFAPVVVDVSGGSSSPWNEQFCVNWDFTNPINTNGQTEYSSGDFSLTIDGWIALVNTKVKLTNQGITLGKYSGSSTGFFVQAIKKDYADLMTGKVMTFSVVVDDALFSVTDTIVAGGLGSHGINPGFSDLFFRIYHYPNSSAGVLANLLGVTVDVIGANASDHVLKAMKLECGTQQTLATMVGGIPVVNKSMVVDEEKIKLVNVKTS